jgi:hypothetical protein
MREKDAWRQQSSGTPSSSLIRQKTSSPPPPPPDLFDGEQGPREVAAIASDKVAEEGRAREMLQHGKKKIKLLMWRAD